MTSTPFVTSTPLVSREDLDTASEALQRAKLDYLEAVLALGQVWDKLAVSMSEDVLRKEAAAKAIYDRAAARLDELKAYWEALQTALEGDPRRLGALPVPWLH